jgi:AraC-like DNA-binding protein
MGTMAIPYHTPVPPAQLAERIAALLGGVGCSRVVQFAVKQPLGAGHERDSGFTQVPYLVLPLEGTMLVHVHSPDGGIRTVACGVGDCAVFASRTWVWCDTQRTDAFLRFTFDVDHILAGYWRRQDTSKGRKRLHGSTLACCVLSHEPPGLIGHLVRSLDHGTADGLATSRAVHEVNVLQHELVGWLTKLDAGMPVGAERTFSLMTAWVRENVHRPLARAGVARAIGVTPGHVSKLFRTLGGTSLVDYVNALRVENAKRLLRDTRLTVGEVGYRVGFNDCNYFVRVFRRLVGVSPGRYRSSGYRGAVGCDM